MMTLEELKKAIENEPKTDTLKKWISRYEDYKKDNTISLKSLMRYLITWEMRGKMENMHSLSTSCLENEFCSYYRMRDDFICHKCYAAETLEKVFPSLKWKLAFSTIILTEAILKESDIPKINYIDFRLEAFGDLNNEIQFKNYHTFIMVNKHMIVTLFTKNPFIIKKAMEKYNLKKPGNMIIIYSEKLLNVIPTDEYLDNIFRIYPFVDKVFIVWVDEDERIKLVNTNKNCFYCRMKCAETDTSEECKFCYEKGINDFRKAIIEKLKK